MCTSTRHIADPAYKSKRKPVWFCDSLPMRHILKFEKNPFCTCCDIFSNQLHLSFESLNWLTCSICFLHNVRRNIYINLKEVSISSQDSNWERSEQTETQHLQPKTYSQKVCQHEQCASEMQIFQNESHMSRKGFSFGARLSCRFVYLKSDMNRCAEQLWIVFFSTCRNSAAHWFNIGFFMWAFVTLSSINALA